MPEYILFDEALRDRFIARAAAHGLACVVRPDRIAGYVIALPDELPEEVEAALEADYEVLMDEQQALVENAEEGGDRTLMAVDITLDDGRQISVCLPAAYARRLYENFEIDEIHALVTAIAREVLHPQDVPLCHRMD
jgi:hypothetical protein